MDLPNQPIANQPEAAIHEDAKANVKSSYAIAAPAQPICTVDFSKSKIKSLNAEVQPGPATFYNSYYGSSWIMHCPGSSYIQLYTNVDSLDATKKYALELVHLSSVCSGTLTDSPITIRVNGNVAVFGHNPNNGNYIRETFDVTPYLTAGENFIEILFDQGARTNYWIQSLAIIQQ